MRFALMPHFYFTEFQTKLKQRKTKPHEIERYHKLFKLLGELATEHSFSLTDLPNDISEDRATKIV